MRRRCLRPEYADYSRYGGRGITICERWDSFKAFHDDMIGSYKPGLTIDRIDNNGPYSPENCRWATYHTQLRNKSNNVNITINGETKCLEDWMDIYGITYGTFSKRRKKGLPLDECITKPLDHRRRPKTFTHHNAKLIRIGDECRYIADWAKVYGIDRRTVYSRTRRGWDTVKAIQTPSML